MQISDRLRELREIKGVSQENVAEACSISRVALARYESGVRKPVIGIVSKLAEYYDVSTDYLLIGKLPQPAVDSSDDKPEISPARKKLLELLKTIPEDQIEKAYNIVAISCDLEKNNKAKKE